MNKDEIILDYLKEQKSYIEIAEAIIRSMPNEDECENVEVPIVRNRLGFITREF